MNFAEFLRTTFFKNTSSGCSWRWTPRNQTTAHNIEQILSLNDPFEGCVAWWLTTCAQRPEVLGSGTATRLAMCRGELSTVMTRLMSNGKSDVSGMFCDLELLIAKRISVLVLQCNGVTSKYSLHCPLVFNLQKFYWESYGSLGSSLKHLNPSFL